MLCSILCLGHARATEAEVFRSAAKGYTKSSLNTQINNEDFLGFDPPFVGQTPDTQWRCGKRSVEVSQFIVESTDMFSGPLCCNVLSNVELLPVSTANVSFRVEAITALAAKEPKAEVTCRRSLG